MCLIASYISVSLLHLSVHEAASPWPSSAQRSYRNPRPCDCCPVPHAAGPACGRARRSWGTPGSVCVSANHAFEAQWHIMMDHQAGNCLAFNIANLQPLITQAITLALFKHTHLDHVHQQVHRLLVLAGGVHQVGLTQLACSLIRQLQS